MPLELHFIGSGMSWRKRPRWLGLVSDADARAKRVSMRCNAGKHLWRAGLWCLLGASLLGGRAMADVDPPYPVDAPTPALIPVCVRVFEQQCGLLTREGTWAVEPAYSALYARGDLWETRRDGKAGALDADGKLLFEPRFAELGRFSGGLASASLTGGVRGASGYVDHRGNWVIPARYFIAGDFSEGLAVVMHWIGGPNDGHSECHYVRPDGEPAFAGKWDNCEAFRFGMAVVEREEGTGSNAGRASVATIDTRGNILIPWGKRHRLLPLSADRVLDRHNALLDRHGKVLFRVPDEGYLDDAGEGRLFYALDDGKRGLLDMQSGRPLVVPGDGWDYTSRFSDGIAWVGNYEPGGHARRILIDLQGRPLLEVDYASVEEFSAGAAAARQGDGRWQLIDRKGQALTKAVYGWIEPAWKWYEQSPRAGDVWRASRRDADETVDWIDASGARLASTTRLPCGIGVVRNARDEIIWPHDVEASCLVAAPGTRDDGWDVPADAGVDDARVMAVRAARARQKVAGLQEFRRWLARTPASEPSFEQKILRAPWQRGPAKIGLAGEATLDLPEGYRYLAPEYVPALRPLFEGPWALPDDGVPAALVVDSAVTVVLRLALVQDGHVEVDASSLDPASLKERMQVSLAGFAGTRGHFGHRSIDWLRRPGWDGDSHRLDWAYSDFVVTGTGYYRLRVVNSLLLGRQSVLAVQSNTLGVHGEDYAVLAQDAIDRVMAGTRFDPGHAYADAKPGERRASRTLSGYVTEEPDRTGASRRSARSAPRSTSGGEIAAWLAGLVLLVVLAVGFWASFAGVRRP